ncbi:MAG: HD domain-containing protein [Candidatus Hydrogenedens sp.]|nr:HD domain-containing protein [Candidatus Hydrogenedens sp.]
MSKQKNAAGSAQELAETNDKLMLLLAEAVDAREEIPPGSAARLREHAARFAEALGLSEDEKLQLERAAVLRAVGKVRLTNDILLKKSVLDYDEWMMLKQYPVHGAELLEEWGLYPEIAPIVRYHQESYDGTGYPDGLEKDAIPALARVLRILVVYCAMTSPRHYRTTVTSHEDAVDYFQRERGQNFDPEFVDVFIAHSIGQPI